MQRLADAALKPRPPFLVPRLPEAGIGLLQEQEMNYQSIESLPQPILTPQENQSQNYLDTDPKLQDQTVLEDIGQEQSEQDGALAKLQNDYQLSLASSDSFQQSSGNTPDLPQVTISDIANLAPKDEPQPDQAKESGGIFPVVGDIIGGAITHVTQHPGDVLMSAATGIGLSAAIGTAAGIIAVTAPAWVTVAGTVTVVTAGRGLLGLGVCAEAPQLISNAQTVSDPSAHTAAEVAKAHEGLQEFGGGAVDFTAGLIGGGAVFKQVSAFAAKTFKPIAAGAEAASAEAAAAGEAAASEASAAS